MDKHFQDIFYLISKDNIPELQEEICRDAYSKCYNWWVDDKPSWIRRKIDMSLDDVLKYLYTNKIHFTIIHRKGYQSEEKTQRIKWYLEIGFCTMNRNNKNGDIFLWIELDVTYI